MNIKARKKLKRARGTHCPNKRIEMVAYHISGYNEDSKEYIAFDGVIKRSENMLGMLFRRHKDLAVLSKVNLNISPM